MAANLPNIQSFIKLYAAQNIGWMVLGCYFFVTLILLSFFNIDIGIPCLYTLVFKTQCPGCGLTRALASLLSFDFSAAWQFNKMAIPVAIGGGYYIIKDALHVYRQANTPAVNYNT